MHETLNQEALEQQNPSKVDLIKSRNNELFLCDACRAVFIQQNVRQALVSKRGLEYQRNLSDLILQALNGCVFCRELLCIPYDFWVKGRAEIDIAKDPFAKRNRVFIRPRDFYNTPAKWPTSFWASKLEKLQYRMTDIPCSMLFRTIFDPKIVFHLRGNLWSQHYIEVTRHQSFHRRKKLKFEVTACEGKKCVPLIFLLIKISRKSCYKRCDGKDDKPRFR